jgi:DNA-binding transcriptional ArsR family regulator
MAEPVSAQLLHAVAHPLRLALLVELEQHGERSPAELAGALGVDGATVEPHLATLHAAGLITADAVPGRVAATGGGWIEVAARLRSLEP